MLRKLRSERKSGRLPAQMPPLTWKNPELRRLVKLLSIATVLNILIGGYYTNATITYMHSANFCGQACHTMTPEFTA
jgi:hypothetical protein